METGGIDEQIAVYRGEALVLVAPLLVVPTELTEYTEAYGLKLLESTERIDAARHTTECTEMIACNIYPSFLWILASRSVGHSVDSKSLSP